MGQAGKERERTDFSDGITARSVGLDVPRLRPDRRNSRGQEESAGEIKLQVRFQFFA
jgi:hypothetical protein